MQKDKKVFLTNEGLAKKMPATSSFDLVNYAIKIAENEIYSGRELPAGEENLATAVLDAIRAGKDSLDFPAAVIAVKKVAPQIIDDEILDEVLKQAFVMDEADNVVMADEEE